MMSAPERLGYLTKVMASYPVPTARMPRRRFGSMSVPSNLPAPRSSSSTCDTMLRPINSPNASHGSAHPPLFPSLFADHPPDTIPAGSCLRVSLICDSAKMCASDVQTPLISVVAGSVGSGAQDDKRSPPAIAMTQLLIEYLENVLRNPLDSCSLMLAFWNDRPARVY